MTALLEVSGVSVSFDGFKAINNLSLNIAEGELHAIIGPNGAGKTTFMDIVTGKTKPDFGRVLWGYPSVACCHFLKVPLRKQVSAENFSAPRYLKRNLCVTIS